jgi:acyl-CoA synthetase (AMP-forming)/AMP-acid ligase II
VADNAVICVEDEHYGQRLVAFVVPHPDADVHEESVREFLKDRVSRFEQPRDIKIVEKISRKPRIVSDSSAGENREWPAT